MEGLQRLSVSQSVCQYSIFCDSSTPQTKWNHCHLLQSETRLNLEAFPGPTSRLDVFIIIISRLNGFAHCFFYRWQKLPEFKNNQRVAKWKGKRRKIEIKNSPRSGKINTSFELDNNNYSQRSLNI